MWQQKLFSLDGDPLGSLATQLSAAMGPQEVSFYLPSGLSKGYDFPAEYALKIRPCVHSNNRSIKIHHFMKQLFILIPCIICGMAISAQNQIVFD